MFKIIIAALLSLVFFTGCDSETSGDQTYESAQTYDISDSQVEDRYVGMLQDEYPEWFNVLTDAQIVELGTGICDGFDAGVSFEEEVFISLEAGYPVDVAGTLIGASIAAFCPQHEGLLE